MELCLESRQFNGSDAAIKPPNAHAWSGSLLIVTPSYGKPTRPTENDQCQVGISASTVNLNFRIDQSQSEKEELVDKVSRAVDQAQNECLARQSAGEKTSQPERELSTTKDQQQANTTLFSVNEQFIMRLERSEIKDIKNKRHCQRSID